VVAREHRHGLEHQAYADRSSTSLSSKPGMSNVSRDRMTAGESRTTRNVSRDAADEDTTDRYASPRRSRPHMYATGALPRGDAVGYLRVEPTRGPADGADLERYLRLFNFERPHLGRYTRRPRTSRRHLRFAESQTAMNRTCQHISVAVHPRWR
jgi:hypothetical protein